MKAAAFKKGLAETFSTLGFKATGKSLRRDQADVSILVSFEQGFGNRWFITVGFWLHSLGALVTDRVEQTHLYFRLERLFPSLRDLITTAGDLDDPSQARAYELLKKALANDGDILLQSLGTENGLREAMKSSRLSHGLVRKEARQILEA